MKLKCNNCNYIPKDPRTQKYDGCPKCSSHGIPHGHYIEMSKIKPRKCPKCKGKIAEYMERMYGYISWDVNNDGQPTNDGIQNPGEPCGVWATCGDCGHIWKLKGIHQIDNLREE